MVQRVRPHSRSCLRGLPNRRRLVPGIKNSVLLFGRPHRYAFSKRAQRSFSGHSTIPTAHTNDFNRVKTIHLWGLTIPVRGVRDPSARMCKLVASYGNSFTTLKPEPRHVFGDLIPWEFYQAMPANSNRFCIRTARSEFEQDLSCSNLLALPVEIPRE